MFDTAIVHPTARRFIFPANDTSLAVFGLDSNGVWVKGADPTKDEQQWSIGITPVRMPFNGGNVQAGHGFSLAEEGSASGDPKGTLVGGVERSLLKVHAINNEGETIDTLENISEPGVLLHGQKRKLVYNEEYKVGDKVDFGVALAAVDSGKVFIESKTDNSAILADTAVTTFGWSGLAFEYLNSVMIRCTKLPGKTRRLGLKDAEDSRYEVWCNEVVGLAMETNDDNWIEESKRKKIVLRTKGDVKIYTSRDMSQQIFPDDNDLLNGKKRGNDYIVDWDDYERVFLKSDSVFASIEAGMYGEFSIIAQWDRKTQEDTKETAVVLGVPKISSIEFLNDIEDNNGANVLRIGAQKYVESGSIIKGAEWKNQKNEIYKYAIAKIKNTSFDLEICLRVPKSGVYSLNVSEHTFSVNFDPKQLELQKGDNIISLESVNALPDYVGAFDINFEWDIISNEQLIKRHGTSHKIYLLYSNPITINTGGWDNYVTDKRLELVLSGILHQNEINSIATEIKKVY